MNINEIKKDRMKVKYAKQISKWNYEGEYIDYNLPSYDEMKSKKYGMTNKEKFNNYIVYYINNEVIAYVNMKDMNNKKLYIGIGLKPSFCGKGLGNYFLHDSLKEMDERFPNYIKYLEVRSWNQRAIKAYEKVGFRITNNVIKKDRLGNDIEFIEMEL